MERHLRRDHRLERVGAALTLRRELLALTASDPELDARIGVSSGSLVAGNVGAEQRFEYMVIGTPVNQASRIADEAEKRLGRRRAGSLRVGVPGLRGRPNRVRQPACG